MGVLTRIGIALDLEVLSGLTARLRGRAIQRSEAFAT